MFDSRIVHPRLMRMLQTHHNARGYITHKTVIQDAGSGEETTTYLPDANLLDIAAQVQENLSGAEVRRPDSTIVTYSWSIALQGYYPQIVVTDQFVTGRDVHDILNVVYDSERAHTTLITEIVSHG